MSPYLLYALVAVGLFWFMLIRPQRNARRRAAELSNALDVGDEVVTIGGLYGFIVSMDDRDVELDVAEGVTLRFARRAIAGRAPEPDDEPDAGEDGEEDELDDEGEHVQDAELVDNIEDEPASEEEVVSETAPKADDASPR